MSRFAIRPTFSFLFFWATSSLVSAFELVLSCVSLVSIDVPGVVHYVELETAISVTNMKG